ncbi:MAG: WD40 repeat domain-containing protein, partial [Bacteroidia bacterium]|nr:WD40 repeat domain-containing protein [Bacteroidia bacterium]
MKKSTFIILTLWGALCLGELKAQNEPILSIDPYGHASMIREVLFARNGTLLISVSDDKTIRFWDTRTGENVETYRGYIGEGSEGKLYAAALSPDEKILAVAGWLSYEGDTEYGRIRLINIETREIIANLTGHTDVVNSLAFSPNGQYLASSGADHSIRVWDISRSPVQMISLLEGHTDNVQEVRFLNDRQLVSVSYDKLGILWDWPSNAINRRLEKHSDRVGALACSPNGKYIITGSYDRKIYLWDNQGKFIKEIAEAEGSVYTASFSDDGSKVIVHGTLGNVARVYSVPAGRELASFDKHNNTVTASDFYANELVVTAGGDNNDIYIWDANNGAVKQHMVGRGYTKRSVGFKKSGTELAFGNTWGGINGAGPLEMSFDFKNFKLNLQAPQADAYQKAITQRGGKTLATTDDYTLKIGEAGTIENSQATDGWIRAYTFTSLGDIAVGNNYTFKFYNADGKVTRNFVGHTGEVWAVAASSNGKLIASAGGDQTVRLWSLEDVGEEDVSSVADFMTHPSWKEVWQESNLVALAETRSKAAWLEIIEKLKAAN